MKTIILLSAALVLSVAGNAQTTSGKSTTSGKIIYEERAKIDIGSEGDVAQFSDAIPKERIIKKSTLF